MDEDNIVLTINPLNVSANLNEGQAYNSSEETAAIYSCKWEGCSSSFLYLSELVSHVSNSHVGLKKDVYTCEWADCPRKGAPQNTRSTLIAHIREKPYVCKYQGCRRTFSRADALSKHQKQHLGVDISEVKVQEPEQKHSLHEVVATGVKYADYLGSRFFTKLTKDLQYDGEIGKRPDNKHGKKRLQQKVEEYASSDEDMIQVNIIAPQIVPETKIIDVETDDELKTLSTKQKYFAYKMRLIHCLSEKDMLTESLSLLEQERYQLELENFQYVDKLMHEIYDK
ncbi:Zinc finger, C2H2 domain-containing protein [Rozella allomycis CSF55]|uniref:Zinc finger, C2H2 domain-containing protein n=1 Tax=Rozella allomycis (strain CSF55) TaxID=988480 RepID=A0A075AV19_ROZAC|nr:Zinc finger, C2H2 domain-containing protein [Rozella allomycis CSF55]|eukprot:EPZ32562.1 Zinc finger, C2H2 domain-containing protein [Rozella allomycis CSF55]